MELNQTTAQHGNSNVNEPFFFLKKKEMISIFKKAQYI